MVNYDFNERLEPEEFQALVCDVISKREGINLFNSPRGRDGNIDSYRFEDKIIVQAKRVSRYSTLKQCLKRELKHIEKFKNQKYILVTSLPLTPLNKQEILEMFNGFLREDDLLGQMELNNLLSQEEYSSVEKKHMKLWLPSSNLFFNSIDEIVHRSVYSASKFEWNNILKTMKIFVQGKNYDKALGLLLKKHSIVISGLPGVGKTALGHALVTTLCNQFEEVQFIKVHDVEDIYKTYDSSIVQIFFFDDFWGMDKYYQENNASMTRLNGLLDVIEEASNKFLIMTTREYIFQEGITKSSKLKDKLLKEHFVLNIYEESDLIRYRILWNHLEEMKLSYNQINDFLKQWTTIVRHRNYTPRLVETFFSLNRDKINDLNGSEINQLFNSYLDNPLSFWEENYEGLIESSRILLLIASTISRYNGLSYEFLKAQYITVIKSGSFKLELLNEFDAGIKQIEDNYMSVYEDDGQLLMDIRNPSFKEFLFSKFIDNIDIYGMAFLNLPVSSYNCVAIFKKVETKNFVNKEIFINGLIDKLIKFINGESDDVLYDILQILWEIDIDKYPVLENAILDYWDSIVYNLYDYLDTNICHYSHLASFVEEMKKYNVSLKEEILLSEVLEYTETYDDFQNLANVLNALSIDVSRTYGYFSENKKEFRKFLEDLIYYNVKEASVENDDFETDAKILDGINLLEKFGFNNHERFGQKLRKLYWSIDFEEAKKKHEELFEDIKQEKKQQITIKNEIRKNIGKPRKLQPLSFGPDKLFNIYFSKIPEQTIKSLVNLTASESFPIRTEDILEYLNEEELENCVYYNILYPMGAWYDFHKMEFYLYLLLKGIELGILDGENILSIIDYCTDVYTERYKKEDSDEILDYIYSFIFESEDNEEILLKYTVGNWLSSLDFSSDEKLIITFYNSLEVYPDYEIYNNVKLTSYIFRTDAGHTIDIIQKKFSLDLLGLGDIDISFFERFEFVSKKYSEENNTSIGLKDWLTIPEIILLRKEFDIDDIFINRILDIKKQYNEIMGQIGNLVGE